MRHHVQELELTTRQLDSTPVDPAEHYLNEAVIHGCPERVVDTLEMLEKGAPPGYLLPSRPADKTFEFFTDRVLPHVAT